MSRREAEPKDTRDETIVEQKLAEMNRLRALELPRRSDTGNFLLEDQQRMLARELMHAYEVVPVHDERTGFWKLFDK